MPFSTCQKIPVIQLPNAFISDSDFKVPEQLEPHNNCQLPQIHKAEISLPIIILRLFSVGDPECPKEISYRLQAVHTDTETWKDVSSILHATLKSNKVDAHKLIEKLRPYLHQNSSSPFSNAASTDLNTQSTIAAKEKGHLAQILTTIEKHTLTIIVTCFLAQLVKNHRLPQKITNILEKDQAIQKTIQIISMLANLTRIQSKLAICAPLPNPFHTETAPLPIEAPLQRSTSPIISTNSEEEKIYIVISSSSSPASVESNNDIAPYALYSAPQSLDLLEDSAYITALSPYTYSMTSSPIAIENNIEHCSNCTLQVMPHNISRGELIKSIHSLKACHLPTPHVPYIQVEYTPLSRQWKIVKTSDKKILIGLAHIHKNKWNPIHSALLEPHKASDPKSYALVLNTLHFLNGDTPPYSKRNITDISQAIVNYMALTKSSSVDLQKKWGIASGILLMASTLHALTPVSIKSQFELLFDTYQDDTFPQNNISLPLTPLPSIHLETHSAQKKTHKLNIDMSINSINRPLVKKLISHLLQANIEGTPITVEQIMKQDQHPIIKNKLYLQRKITACEHVNEKSYKIKGFHQRNLGVTDQLLEDARKSCPLFNSNSEIEHCFSLKLHWREDYRLENPETWEMTLMHVYAPDKVKLEEIGHYFRLSVRSEDKIEKLCSLFPPPKEISCATSAEKEQIALEQFKSTIAIEKANHLIKELTEKPLDHAVFSRIIYCFNKSKYPKTLADLAKSIETKTHCNPSNSYQFQIQPTASIFAFSTPSSSLPEKRSWEHADEEFFSTLKKMRQS